MLNEYVKIFSDLNRSKSNSWPEETKFEAPHKPLLLLSVVDLIKEGVISSNIIDPTDHLSERFAKLWDKIGLENLDFEAEPSIHLPFFHLANENEVNQFWHLIIKPGMEEHAMQRPGSLEKLREVFVGAEINEDLFKYLSSDDSRSVLRETLTQTYFSPAVAV